MKAEELLKEAELFKRGDACYIHAEVTDGGNAPMRIILTGHDGAIITAVFAILCRVEETHGLKVLDMLNALKRCYKKFGAMEAEVLDDVH